MTRRDDGPHPAMLGLSALMLVVCVGLLVTAHDHETRLVSLAGVVLFSGPLVLVLIGRIGDRGGRWGSLAMVLMGLFSVAFGWMCWVTPRMSHRPGIGLVAWVGALFFGLGGLLLVARGMVSLLRHGHRAAAPPEPRVERLQRESHR